MIGFLIRVVVVGLGLWLSTIVVPGVHVNSLQTLAIAALLLGLANAIVRPVLVILTLPLTILTLGLFLVVINAAMIWLVAYVLPGFEVRDWMAVLLCWVVVTMVGWVASAFVHR